jgi:hypothetical protein
MAGALQPKEEVVENVDYRRAAALMQNTKWKNL